MLTSNILQNRTILLDTPSFWVFIISVTSYVTIYLHADRNLCLFLEKLVELPKRNIQETPADSEGNLEFDSDSYKIQGH